MLVTEWRAVFVGTVINIIAGAVGSGVPYFGNAAGGLLGGFVAGYLAGGRPRAGVWHGLLAGVPGSLVVGVFVALGGVVLFGLGAFFIGAALGASVLVGSVLGGLAGAYTA